MVHYLRALLLLLTLLLIAMLSTLSSSAQVVEDIRLSPDDQRSDVLLRDQVVQACRLGDRTMVVWGVTVGDENGGEHLALMIGLLQGDAWIKTPRVLARYEEEPTRDIRVIALDSVFVVTWQGNPLGDGRGLHARAFDREGDPITPPLPLPFGIVDTWADPAMPGLWILMRSGAVPVAMTFDGALQIREVVDAITPSTSFQITSDTSLSVILNDSVVRYRTIFETTPLWKEPLPATDSTATAQISVIAQASRESYSIMLLTVWFSEEYSQYGCSDTASVIVDRYDYERPGALPSVARSARYDEIVGDVGCGTGLFMTYRRGHARTFCDGAVAGFAEFERVLMLHGSATSPGQTRYVTAHSSAEGEVTLYYSFEPTETICTPSGSLVDVVYLEDAGETSLRLIEADREVLLPAIYQTRSTPRRHPRLVQDQDGLSLLWDLPNTPLLLHRLDRFDADAIVPTDTIERITLEDPRNHYGCTTLHRSNLPFEGPGHFFLAEAYVRTCVVGYQSTYRNEHKARTRLGVVAEGEFRPLIDSTYGPTQGSNEDLYYRRYEVSGYESDDSTLLVRAVHDIQYRTSRSTEWIVALSPDDGSILWQSSASRTPRHHALPTGGGTWVYFRGDTMITMERDQELLRSPLPTLGTPDSLTYQSLPGPFIIRIAGLHEGSREVTMQLVNHATGFVSEQRVLLPAEALSFAPAIMTHPRDESRFLIWGTASGLYFARYSSDFLEVLTPPTRLSATTDTVRHPSGLFKEETLMVVWEDYRDRVPAIYGLKIDVKGEGHTIGVERERGITRELDLTGGDVGKMSDPLP